MSKKSIFFEVYNEITVLMISYLQIPLVENVTDTNVKNGIGWAIVIMVLVNITVNFISLMVTVIKFIHKAIKKCRLKKK